VLALRGLRAADIAALIERGDPTAVVAPPDRPA
jgi:hypothetical protein